MRVSEGFIQLLESFEGFRSCPYKDQGGVPTIGIGTITYPVGGIKVTMADKCISKETAETYLKSFVAGIETELDDVLPRVTQNQYDALMSLIYNIGTGAFKNSTLLRKLKVNTSDPSIKQEFYRWCNVNKKPNQGLLERRHKEANLYFT